MWLSPLSALSGGSHFKLVMQRIITDVNYVFPLPKMVSFKSSYYVLFLRFFWLHLARMPESRMLFPFSCFVSIMSEVQRAQPRGTMDHDCRRPVWIKSLPLPVNGPYFAEHLPHAQAHAGRAERRLTEVSVTLPQRHQPDQVAMAASWGKDVVYLFSLVLPCLIQESNPACRWCLSLTQTSEEVQLTFWFRVVIIVYLTG